MDHLVLRAVIRGTERVVGRRRLAQMARLVTSEVRLDGPNGIGENGEAIVQRLALSEPEPVVLDVGCHFGEWSQSLLQQPGSRPKLHAFEPSTYSYERAASSLAGQGSVYPFGFSDRPGTAELLVVHPGAGSNSIVPFAEKGRRTSDEVEAVTLSTVDIFCSKSGVGQVTLMKIDAEGHDLAVMRGARSMLEQRAISLIQFEYNFRWIDARVFLLDVFDLLEPLGYRLGKVTPRGIETYRHWHPELETFRESNYLAYLPEWEDRMPVFEWWGG